MSTSLFEERKYKPQEPRTYQMDAIIAIEAAWARGIRALIAVATGGGKTTIIAEALKRNLDPRERRGIVIAHTEEIITQLSDRIANQYNGVLDSHYGAIFAKGIGVVMAEQNDYSARIVVATRQSLHSKRLAQILNSGRIDYVVIDEAHHAAPGNTYLDIVDEIRRHNPEVKILGVTATPKRSDELALGAAFDEIVYEWLIPEGIRAGYLVPATRIKVSTEVSLSAVANAHGDYNTSSLVNILETSNWDVLAYRAYKEYILNTGRLALAFFPSVAMSRQFVGLLQADGIKAAHIDGTTPKDERRKILGEYKAERLQIVSNMGVLTEGFDEPKTAAILMARPTRSPTLFTQIVGRGLRPYPGKADCLLIDLAVTDVRALERGDLIGRMVFCKGCGAEHFEGLRACPRCDYVRPLKERVRDGAPVLPEEEEEARKLSEGGRLVAHYETIFEKAFAAWYSGDDGFFSCTLSFEQGAYIIMPPVEDEYYRLVLVPKDRNKKIVGLERNEDLSSLMLVADERVKAVGGSSAGKLAAWRDKPPSAAQIRILADLGLHVPEGMTMGMASQLITHYLNVRRLVRG